MSDDNKQLVVTQQQNLTAFSGPVGFESAQRMAMALVSSTMVPESYRGKDNIGNAIIALEMAQRMGASPMAVMQNLHVIEGRPSWSSSFIIGALNSCNRFSPLRFRIEDRGEKSVSYEFWDGPKGSRQKKTGTLKIQDKACIAWAYDRATNDILEGPEASLEMAIKEGWYTKNGSKWQTMPDLMLRYRAAAFFGRLYAPDVLMGMHTEEEVIDIGPQPDAVVAPTLVEPAVVEPPKKPRATRQTKVVEQEGPVEEIATHEVVDTATGEVIDGEPLAETEPESGELPELAGVTGGGDPAEEGDLF